MTPIPAIDAIGLAAAGAQLCGWGTAIMVRTRAHAAAALVVVSGVLALVTAGLHSRHGASVVLAVAGQTLGLAVMAYPQVERKWTTALAAASLVAVPVALTASHADSLGIAAVVVAVPMLQIWWRLETSGRSDRLALTWLLVAAVPVTLVAAIVAFTDAPAGAMAAVAAASGVIGWAAWRGLTRPAEVDVRSIASSLAVNGVALICVLSLFKIATTTVRALGGSDRLTPTIAIVAAVCSIALEPIRRHLRLAVEAILFGRRPDPVVAAGRVARGIGDDPRSALGAVVGALSLPFAELRVDDLPTVSAGESTSSVQSVPVVLGGQNVGELVVGLRAGDRRLTAADTTVLALAAPLLAQTMRSRALADSLQEARERAADAREEERRRLRRDLHDGLGPRLSGIAFTADAVLLARTEPAATTDQLTRLRTEAVTAIREIRELVYGLRPPALDEFGLVRALELQTAALATADGRALRVQIHATDLPELPASVEVAAYRIAVESLTNAARHSGSDCARVHLACDGPQLVITVTDGGRADGPWTPGVGLVSMRERAQELGGTLTAGHGTVRAVLPIRVPDQA